MTIDRHARFRSAGEALARHVTSRYGVVVERVAIAPPFKGDLDGRRILVGVGCDPGEELFLVAHLFGHTVQWNISASQRRLGMTMPVAPDAAMLAALDGYEHEACRYSQRALHDAGIAGMDQWLADHSACDRAYLHHFYTTGERRAFRSFWKDGTPLVEPLPIPPFSPRCFRRRTTSIVI